MSLLAFEFGNLVFYLRGEHRVGESLDVVLQDLVIVLIVVEGGAVQQQGAVLAVQVFLEFLFREVVTSDAQGIDVGRRVVAGIFKPLVPHCADHGPDVINTISHQFNVLHQHELVERGHIGSAQFIAPDDAGQRGHGHLLERLAVGHRLLRQRQDHPVKLLAVPLAHVGGFLAHRVVAVTPARKAVTVALVDQCLEVVEQRLDVRLFLLGDDFLDALDDVGHVVLRDAALRDAVAHQRVHGHLAVARLQRLVQVGERGLAHVLREIEVNLLLTA